MMRAWRGGYGAVAAVLAALACVGGSGPGPDGAGDSGGPWDAPLDVPADADLDETGDGADPGGETGFVDMIPDEVAVPGGCGGAGPCPDGRSCRLTVGEQGQIVPACLPEDDLLCRPCAKHAECQPPGTKTNDLCVEAAPGAGFFCGRGCLGDLDCPAGYACREAGTTEGKPAFQCVPSEGECTCSVEAITAGLETACAAGNAHGRCPGRRWCAASGLTACDAPEPAREKCGNEVDEDCDGVTDEEGCEGCTILYRDEDMDDHGVAGDARCLARAEGFYRAEDAGDCDDLHPGIHPGAKEACNGLDDDCDGETDSRDALGCMLLYRDADRDGNGAPGSMRCLCAPAGLYTADDEADCLDTDPAVHPGAFEACNGVDDDCDGLLDAAGSDGCSTYYVDKDLDLHGIPGQSKCLCGPVAPYTAQTANDCADDDPLTFAGAQEICGNGKDEDCDGPKDEAGCLPCVPWYRDIDHDGWGQTADSECHPAPSGMYSAPRGGDCNDLDKSRNPAATEKCGDGKDDDCDGETDEAGASGCVPYYLDEDGDGAGVWASAACLCAPAAPFSAVAGGDCDDEDPDVGPAAPERCNGVDDDCDGETDTAMAGAIADCTVYFRDQDGDGSGAGPGRCLCAPSAVHVVAKSGDCDDKLAEVRPGAQEACNGRDDDCNGATDEADAAGCTPYWQDLDGDGYGAGAKPFCLCAPTGKHTAPEGGDCDDGAPWTYPGSPERCNGIDDDCDGETDEAACVQ